MKEETKITLHSRRRYAVAFIDGVEPESFHATLKELLTLKPGMGEDFEYKYAISDGIDKILDLKQGETLYMAFNRDNVDAMGVIKRIE